MEQQSYLSDIEFTPVLANTGKRFLNYLVDLAVYYALLFCFGVFLTLSGANSFAAEDNVGGLYIVAFAVYIAYFALCEILFKGRTIGKLITGTKAVNEDGTEPDPKTFFLRALSRIVPFEPFSALGNPSRPWHDKWTNTCVIDVKKTALNNSFLQQ